MLASSQEDQEQTPQTLQMSDGDQVYCKRLLEQFHLGDAVNKANHYESITIRVHLFNGDKFHVKIRRKTLLLIKSHFPSSCREDGRNRSITIYY